MADGLEVYWTAKHVMDLGTVYTAKVRAVGDHANEHASGFSFDLSIFSSFDKTEFERRYVALTCDKAEWPDEAAR